MNNEVLAVRQEILEILEKHNNISIFWKTIILNEVKEIIMRHGAYHENNTN